MKLYEIGKHNRKVELKEAIKSTMSIIKPAEVKKN